MKKFEKIYQELSKKYSDKEIAESMLIPEDLTSEEQKIADDELKEIRFRLLRERTEEQRVYSDLLRFKFQLEDYLKIGSYHQEQSFGNHLNEYIRIVKKTKKELAQDLGIHYSRLSRIFNDKEDPNVELAYRLEKHSGKLVPALIWWKLVIKKQEYDIKRNVETRNREWSKVESIVPIRA